MEQTTPENQVTYVGVDIAKDRLDYTVDDTRCAHVENTHRGHRALIKHLQSLPNARVVCEATGGYERAIVAALLLAQIQVCVVNPGRVRAFARAAGFARQDRPTRRSIVAPLWVTNEATPAPCPRRSSRNLA
ncbi:MAG: transposase [Candidatus Synoicihabitans palmerolidicus]|nr:transposase [Candidatus Synoicihabitans palmerolidicus]